MEVIYISSACNSENVDEINKTAIKKLEISGIKFHNLLMRGLSENNVKVKSIIGLPISNSSNKKKIWKKKVEEKENIKYHQVGFINLPILKQLSTAINIFFTFIKLAKNKSDVYTIIDATYISVLPFILFANQFVHTKLIAIVADIYDYMANVDNSNGKANKLKQRFRNKNQQRYLKMDGFILLTEQMNEVINLNKKPYIVIEGCSDSNMNNVNNTQKNEKRVILYSGKLSEKFGIKLLIEAFNKIKQDDVELWIYGDGEAKDYVSEEAKKNSKIIYKGLVSNQEVVMAQMKATLLVNPRPTEQQFTKYSFPSKNIEYMASGTPMLTTILPGMPKEYYDYVFLIKDESVNGLYKAMCDVLAHPTEEIELKGKIAKEFIMKNKNEKVQAKKILGFLEGV